MKLNILETHDRLEHFKKDQAINIFEGAEECLKHNKISLALQEKSPYVYIFAHPRTADDGITRRMLWQARLTKPEPQDNSYLFRAISNTDMLEVCWLLPPKELWNQYLQGQMMEEPTILWSINQYKYHKNKMRQPEHDDLSDERIREIYKDIYRNFKRDFLVESSFSSEIESPAPSHFEYGPS